MKTPFRKQNTRRFFTVVSLSALVALCFCSGDREPKDSDVALTVNGKGVTYREIEEVVALQRFQQAYLTPESVLDGTNARRGAAKQLASNVLMLESVKAKGWETPTAIVDSIANGIMQRFGGPEAFKARLAEIGESEENMRRDIAESILVDSLMKTISVAAEPVSDEDARAHYEANKNLYTTPGRARADHIIFAFDPASDVQSQVPVMMEKANAALAKAKKGDDFGNLVKEYSSSSNNPDMGWFKKGDLNPDLDNALFALKIGEVSTLVPSGMGIHIMKKTAEESPRQMEFDEVSARIKRTLEAERNEKAVNDYIDSLLASANIKFSDKSLDFRNE